MNEIFFNSYNQKDYNGITNVQATYTMNSNTNLSNHSNNQTKSTDTIEISEKNKNIINTKKAYDAFKDTCSDFGYVKFSNGNGADMSLYYNRALDMMELQGISVPSFVPDSQNSTSYLSFLDKVKDFIKNLNTTKPGFLPDCLTDFCDSYKEKLTQYGCK